MNFVRTLTSVASAAALVGAIGFANAQSSPGPGQRPSTPGATTPTPDAMTNANPSAPLNTTTTPATGNVDTTKRSGTASDTGSMTNRGSATNNGTMPNATTGTDRSTSTDRSTGTGSSNMDSTSRTPMSNTDSETGNSPRRAKMARG